MPRACSLLLLLIVAACREAPSDQAPAPPASATSSASAAPSAQATVAPEFTPATSPSSAPPLSARRQRLLDDDLDQKKREIAHTAYARMPQRTVDGMFLLVAGEPSAPIDAAEKVVHDTVTALFHGPLAHRTDHATLVWVFADPERYRPFLQERVGGKVDPKALGYYDEGTDEIYVCTGPGGVTTGAHEIAHVLVGGADFPLAPLWLQEGIAAQLEAADFNPPGEVHGKAHFRLQTLRTMLASPDQAAGVRLDAVFALKDTQLVGPDAYVAYGLSREALRWLDSRHQLWRFYRTWRDGVLDDPTGEKAFVAVVGRTPRAASEEWRAWIRSPEAERP